MRSATALTVAKRRGPSSDFGPTATTDFVCCRGCSPNTVDERSRTVAAHRCALPAAFSAWTSAPKRAFQGWAHARGSDAHDPSPTAISSGNARIVVYPHRDATERERQSPRQRMKDAAEVKFAVGRKQKGSSLIRWFSGTYPGPRCSARFSIGGRPPLANLKFTPTQSDTIETAIKHLLLANLRRRQMSSQHTFDPLAVYHAHKDALKFAQTKTANRIFN